MKRTIFIVQHGKDAPVFCETREAILDYLQTFEDCQSVLLTPIEAAGYE